MASLNDWAYTPEEQEQIRDDEDLNNRIMIEEEIDGTVKIMKAMEVKFQDISRLRDSLLENGGMSRFIAEEAAVIMPDNQSMRNVKAFTTTPTAVGYSKALEEITLGMAAAIAGIAAAAIAMIVKFISWLTGEDIGTSGSGSGGSKAITAAENNQKVTEEILKDVSELTAKNKEIVEDVKGLFDSGVRVKIGDKEAVVRSLRDLADLLEELNENKKLVDMVDENALAKHPFVADQIVDGEFSRYLMDNAKALGTLLSNTVDMTPEVHKVLVAIDKGLTSGNLTEAMSIAGGAAGTLAKYSEEVSKTKEEVKKLLDKTKDSVATVARYEYFKVVDDYLKFVEKNHAKFMVMNKHAVEGVKGMITMNTTLKDAKGLCENFEMQSKGNAMQEKVISRHLKSIVQSLSNISISYTFINSKTDMFLEKVMVISTKIYNEMDLVIRFFNLHATEESIGKVKEVKARLVEAIKIRDEILKAQKQLSKRKK